MTSLEETAPIAALAETAPELSTVDRALRRVEDWLDRAGDRLNPILIKEARQALKSKQFTITFTLLLTCGWLWSIAGLALAGPNAYYASNGADMFYGYFLILAFPLLVIVPYAAFRSLASELEDRTYELLSITTLRARQIIGGKLSTAVLQMVVYLSAIAPCLAFTYLLRGIDILTVLLIVTYTVLASAGLALLALLCATATHERYQQIVLSVALVLGLAVLFLGACGLTGETLSIGRVPLDEPDFWKFNAGLLTAYASYFVLLYLAAATQLSFPSSNRSSGPRVVMVVQQVLFTGWLAYVWLYSLPQLGSTTTIGFVFCSLLHWYAMGVFLTGEPPTLSPRVKRDLPQSFLGRAFFTWFNPGPGTGFMLVVTNCVAVALLASLGELLAPSIHASLSVTPSPPLAASGPFTFRPERVFQVGVVGISYVVIYLGLGKLLLGILRRVTPVGVLARLMAHGLLVGFGTTAPLFVQFLSPDLRNLGYSALQISNPFWTMTELTGRSTAMPDVDIVMILLPLVALLVFVANLPSIVQEVRHVRVVAPERVAEEDAELAAQHAPAVVQKTSPWD